LDKVVIENIKKDFYKICPIGFIRELIVDIYGSEAKTYADRFFLTDILAIKYKMIVLDNINYIENKNICDIGCNSGLWPIVFAKHGAKSVIGIEPRSLFKNGLEKFIKKHNLPVKMIVGDHNSALTLIKQKNPDTLVMMSVDDIIPSFEDFIHKCVTTEVKNFILQCNTVSDSVIDTDIKKKSNHIGFTVHYEEHNTNLRSGLNPYTEILDKNGLQTKFDDSFDLTNTAYVRNVRSERFLEHILKSNNLHILANKKPKIPLSDIPHREHLHSSMRYHWFTATKKPKQTSKTGLKTYPQWI